MAAPFTFILPDELSAKEPPERRGVPRDRVRLLVLDRATGAIQHSRFDRLKSISAPEICWSLTPVARFPRH